jgi:ketosteroid isomerase-like protein
VAIQITWEGTQSGPLQVPGGEIAPTGRKVTVQACQVMRVEDGKAVEACHYFDMLGMLEQLGTVSAESLAHAG